MLAWVQRVQKHVDLWEITISHALADFEAFSTIETCVFGGPELSSIEQTRLHPQIQIPNACPLIADIFSSHHQVVLPIILFKLKILIIYNSLIDLPMQYFYWDFPRLVPANLIICKSIL